MKMVFCCALSLILLAGCAARGLDLSLDFEAPGVAPAPVEGSLGVVEFKDLRPRVSSSDAWKWLGFIPGVLWIEMVSEVPESYTAFSDYNAEDFKSAFARSFYNVLNKEGLFGETVFLPLEGYARVDYLLEGTLYSTRLKETGYYYGSGFYAWLTRILGLPYVSYEINVDINLVLRRTDTGTVVWSTDVRGSRRDKYNTIYRLASGRGGKDVLSHNFSKILEESMPALVESMRKSVEDDMAGSASK